MKTFRPCRLCEDGWIKTTSEKGEGIKRCSCYITWAKSRSTEIKLDKAKVPLYLFPEGIVEYDIEKDYIGPNGRVSIIPKLKFYLEHFETRFKDKLLYFYGDSGTQKTTVSTYLLKEISEKGFTINYILMNDLLRLLQKSDFNEDLIENVEELYSTDFLVIDRAFSKDQVLLYKSGHQLSFIDTFLRKRIEQYSKATLIVSNTNPEDITSHGYTSDSQDFILRKILQADSLFHFVDRYTLKDDFVIENLWS